MLVIIFGSNVLYSVISYKSYKKILWDVAFQEKIVCLNRSQLVKMLHVIAFYAIIFYELKLS